MLAKDDDGQFIGPKHPPPLISGVVGGLFSFEHPVNVASRSAKFVDRRPPFDVKARE